MNKVSVLILIFAIVKLSLSHEIDENSELIQLSEMTFNSYVRQGRDSGIFVMFFSPRCGHCTRAMPEWTNFANKMKGNVLVGVLDASQHGQTASRFDVNGYPTFIFMKEGKMYKYEGMRNTEDWTRFVEEEYKYREAQNLPISQGTDWEKAFAPFKKIYEQIVYLIFNKPLEFAAMITVVIFMTWFTIMATSWLANKMSAMDDMEKEALKLEKEAIAKEEKEERENILKNPKTAKSKKD